MGGCNIITIMSTATNTREAATTQGRPESRTSFAGVAAGRLDLVSTHREALDGLPLTGGAAGYLQDTHDPPPPGARAGPAARNLGRAGQWVTTDPGEAIEPVPTGG